METEQAQVVAVTFRVVPVYMAIAFHAMLALIGAWDLFCWASARENDTVSAVIWEWSHSFPPFTLLVGFVLGHLFWQSPLPRK